MLSLMLLTFIISKIWLNVSIMAKFSSKSVSVRGETISNDLLGDGVTSMMTVATVINLRRTDTRRRTSLFLMVNYWTPGARKNKDLSSCNNLDNTYLIFLYHIRTFHLLYVHNVKMIQLRVHSVDQTVMDFDVFYMYINGCFRSVRWRQTYAGANAAKPLWMLQQRIHVNV